MEIERQVPTKKRIRSNMDRYRLRLEALENILLRFTESFKPVCGQDDYDQLLHAYLSWTKQQLRNFEQDDININNVYFLQRLNSFDLKIKYALSEIKRGQSLKGKRKQNLYSLKQPQFEYGIFLQQGIIVFTNVIDVYSSWLKPPDILSIISTKEPLSYVFIALLARYTLNRNDPRYRFIYGTALRNIKASIPKMYETNSINNVIALSLLTYIMMSHYKIGLAARYFSLAIRMAQTLGLSQNKITEGQIMDERKERLRYGLSLTYFIISTLGPEISFPDFIPEDFHLKLSRKESRALVNESQFDLTKLRVENFFSTEVGSKSTSLFVKVSSYSQRIKASYPLQNIEHITNDELRLPSNEFNSVVTELLSLNQDRSVSDRGEHKYNIIYFKIIYQLHIINLYYPIVLIYPKPVKFNLAESMLLLQAANQFFTEYNNLYCYFDEESKDKAQVLKLDNDDDERDQVKFGFPHYLKTFPIIIVWLNCMDLNNSYLFDAKDLDLCQTNCIHICELLYSVTKQNSFKSVDDCKFVLNKVKHVIHRFLLSHEFLNKLNSYLN